MPSALVRSGPRASQGGNPAFNWGFAGAGGHLVVDSPTVKALVGHVAGNYWPLGALTVENASSSNGWMGIIAVARDGKPLDKSASIIIATLNRAENTNMAWNAARTSVGDGWGTGPTLLETPRAALSLRTSAKGARVWALDATGARVRQIPSVLKNGVLRFALNPADKTPWLEIALAPRSIPKTPITKPRATSVADAELRR